MRGVALADDGQPLVEIVEHRLVDAVRRRLAAEQLRDQAEGRKSAAAGAVELGHRAQVELVDDLEQRVARLDQLDLARHDTGFAAGQRRRLLVGGADIDVAARLDQDARPTIS